MRRGTSRTFATGKGKVVCRHCGRTVSVVKLSDGTTADLDPEIMTVVPYEPGVARQRLQVRRLHGEVCLRYRLEAERAEARARLRGDDK